MIKDKPVNILKVEGSKLTCSFNSSGTAENVQPVSTGETWYFKEELPIMTVVNFTNIQFSSNSQRFCELDKGKFAMIYIKNDSTSEVVYAGGWNNETYRTITLEQPATGDLLTFLQANATKIS